MASPGEIVIPITFDSASVVGPDDYLVLQTDKAWTDQQMAELSEMVKEHFPGLAGRVLVIEAASVFVARNAAKPTPCDCQNRDGTAPECAT
jgi:hypothetical protein